MGRYAKAAERHVQSAQKQITENTTNPFLALQGLNNGNYHAALTDSLVIKLIRSFGLNADNDRRFFFERTGRLSHVIHRARVF